MIQVIYFKIKKKDRQLIKEKRISQNPVLWILFNISNNVAVVLIGIGRMYRGRSPRYHPRKRGQVFLKKKEI